jgi:hypothetical protein
MSTRKLEGPVGARVVGELPPLPQGQSVEQRSTALPLGPVEFLGSATPPGTLPAAGQTTQSYLDRKNFQRKSQEVLAAEFKALLGAWPKDTPPGVTPEAFAQQAEALDAYKANLWSALGTPKNADLVRQLVSDLNVLHGKGGHTENVIATTLALVADPKVNAELGLQDPQSRRDAAQRLTQAATWLNLCDAEIPVGILGAPRRLTDEETTRYVKPRAERSAALLQGLLLAGPDVVLLVHQHRGGPDRPLLAQLLDLADQAAAMAAKPFFQKDGQVDGEKLGAALRGNAEKAGLHGGLVEAVVGAIHGGAMDAALKKARAQDLWVR